MNMSRFKPHFSWSSYRLAIVALALFGLVVVVAACGGSGSSSSSSTEPAPSESEAPAETETESESEAEPAAESGLTVAKAEEMVAEFQEEKPFEGPSSSPEGVKGKSITVVACPLEVEGCSVTANSVKEAASHLGWNTKIVDGKGTPQASTAGVEQAIAEGTDGIVLVAVDKELVAPALPKAASAGIPIVGYADNNEPGEGPENVFAEVSLGANVLGTMIASWAVADSNGEAKVAMFNAPELSTIQQRYEASKGVFEECEGCEVVTTQEFALASAGTKLPLLTSNVLTSNPDADYLWDPSGSLGSLQAATVDQSQSAGKVKVITFDCVKTNLEEIKKGTGSLAACAGVGLVQSGYAIVDQMNRAFAGEPPAEKGDEQPSHLIDATNVPDPNVGWPGDEGFEEGYLKLWGVS
jgi:ribose transport system substrate-binding protein